MYKILVYLALSLPLVIFLYSWFVEPVWIEATAHDVTIGHKGSPITLVQLSDLHMSDYGRTEQGVIKLLTASTPDIVVLTGDTIDDKESLPALDVFLSKLPNTLRFAVLGNWEYWSGTDLEALRLLYIKHNVQLLVNECVALQINGGPLRVAGLDDYTASFPDLDEAMKQCPGTAPLVVLEHSPGLLEKVGALPAGPRPLILAGHTHGGQLAIGRFAIFTPRGSGGFVAGWYDTALGQLYVSRGIGTSVLPLRFSARPEVATFTLR